MKAFIQFMIISILAVSSVAKAEDFTITIDAQKDAWYDGLTGPADGLVFMPAACYLPDIGTGPDNDADLSAIVWMSYDEQYLYCYAEVKDDIVKVSNSSTWLNDCIELKFDPDPDFGAASETSNMRLTALDEDLAELPAGVDNINGSQHLRDLANTPYVPTEDDYARRLTDDGYVLEFRVPQAYINTPDGRSLQFNEIGKFGMAINIGDNDTGSRDNMLQWSAGHSDAAHSDPSLLGTVTFLENNKLQLEAVNYIDPSVVNENADEWYTNPNANGISDKVTLAESYDLLSNYPNPFNPETTIQYHINRAETATLGIYNMAGELIRQLCINQFHSPGSYEISWNSRDEFGEPVGSGVYFYRLTTPSQVVTNKMILLK